MKDWISKKTALVFIVLLGVVSLFADITYEGARSIMGQYLEILGASGVVVGIVVGFGEFVGYGFRLVSGYVSDKTRKYWLITFIGYALNLIAVPLLALAGNWQFAAFLIIMERFGKAIRNPARDAMLSYATHVTGRGWGFGLHEALDQVGAILGPLIVTSVLYFRGSYQESFLVLLIPAFCALTVLGAARLLYPHPEELEDDGRTFVPRKFTKTYWLYIAAICFVAAGYVDFPLMAYHFKKMAVIPDIWIPIFFSIAMAADGIAALVFGRLYDSKGLRVLLFSTVLSSLFVFFAFLGGFNLACFGIVLWGIGLGAQESVLRAVIGNIVAIEKRGTAYGIFNAFFGIAWMLGSSLMGFFYDVSIPLLVAFSFCMQLFALPFFYIVQKISKL